jgi:hypothetical protein
VTRLQLLALGLGALGAGCVVPVGPQFQDPIAAQNFPPQITSTLPESGALVQAMPDFAKFEISVSDQNVGDTLYVRWAVDYPPRDQVTSRQVGNDVMIPPNGFLERQVPQVIISCNLGLQIDQPQHSVWVAVADKKFSLTAPDFWTLEDNTRATETRSWTLALTCEVP